MIKRCHKCTPRDLGYWEKLTQIYGSYKCDICGSDWRINYDRVLVIWIFCNILIELLIITLMLRGLISQPFGRVWIVVILLICFFTQPMFIPDRPEIEVVTYTLRKFLFATVIIVLLIAYEVYSRVLSN